MKLWIDKTAWVSPRAQRIVAGLHPPDIRRIAVIKHGALGDMLLTRPFLITLREYFPEAQITLSAASHYLNGIPEDLIDRLHVGFGKKERGKSLPETLRNYKSLGAHDLLFDLTSNARSLWVTRLNPARVKIGFIPSGGHRRFFKLIYDVAAPRTEYKFEAETFLDQLNVLGLQHRWPLRFDLPVQERSIPEKYILYFPGASDPYKCWPAEHFTGLIGQMLERFGERRHVVLGGVQEWEKQRAREVAAPFRNNEKVVFREGGETAFALVAHAECFIGNDTGIRNYAVAAGVPTVGIFFSTLPFRYLPRFGKHRAVFELEGGAPAVEKVYRAALEILAEPS